MSLRSKYRLLSEEELRVILAEIENLREQARQVADAMGIEYIEALMLLALREAVIASNACRQVLTAINRS